MISSQDSRSVIGLIVLITVVPLVSLWWLGWRLLDQDRMLEEQQIRDRVDRAADLIMAEIEQGISNSRRRLIADSEVWPEGSAAAVFENGSLSVYPRERAAFVPVPTALPEAPASAFMEGERLEFQLNDPSGAIELFSETANSDDLALRAGSLHRLGRNLRKAERTEEALSVYAELSEIDGASTDGVPAALVGRFARLQILEAEGRTADFEVEAAQLSHDLRYARWSLTEPIYRLYLEDVERWHVFSDRGRTQAERFGKALQHVWARWGDVTASFREPITIGGESLAVLWEVSGNETRALIVTQAYAESQWLPAAIAVAEDHNVRLALHKPEYEVVSGNTFNDDRPSTELLAQVTRLPWNVSVASAVLPGEDPSFIRRRQLLIAGFALVAAMALTASYFIFRAVNRERALVRMQSEFVGAVSHEFRTPLTALRQFTDMLLENRPLGEDRRRVCYEALGSATDRLQHLVESLLDFGRMEAGAQTYHMESLDCAMLVRDVVEEFRIEAGAGDRYVRLDADVKAKIQGDPEALARALRNLLDNAAKYSPGQHHIEVTVTPDGENVIISVRDHGIGIPPGELGTIFAKFHRGEQARARGIRGTGIGLAMVDDVVRAHGGRVEVDSEPDEGSTFTIVLPLDDQGERAWHVS